MLTKTSSLMKINDRKRNTTNTNITKIAERFLEVTAKELMLSDNGHSKVISSGLYTDLGYKISVIMVIKS